MNVICFTNLYRHITSNICSMFINFLTVLNLESFLPLAIYLLNFTLIIVTLFQAVIMKQSTKIQ